MESAATLSRYSSNGCGIAHTFESLGRAHLTYRSYSLSVVRSLFRPKREKHHCWQAKVGVSLSSARADEGSTQGVRADGSADQPTPVVHDHGGILAV